MKFKNQFMNIYKLKDQCYIELILWMKIQRDRVKKTMKIDQSLYVKKILKRFNMSDAKDVNTPESGVRLTLKMCPNSEKDKERMSYVPYRAAVGALAYAASGTRPDISHAVNECAKFSHNPGDDHWMAIKRIMRYLVGTTDTGLIYGSNANEITNVAHINAFTDADWAGDTDDRKSTGGYLIKMNGDSVNWSSRKQRTVALSSAEAEYMAISETAKEAKWIKQLLQEMKVTNNITILTDNQAAKQIATNDIYHDRTKHIDIRYHFVRNDIANGVYDIKWISTRVQLADVFTKGLKHIQHVYLCDRILNQYIV
jgi:hypothetical protein